MTITLKTNPTDKVIELGGGSHPLIRPNVDVRICHNEKGERTVDFTADFHQPLPIQSDEWDGVFSQFAIEHIAYPQVPQFVSEVFRILKPGGKAVVITANTEAQLKWTLEHPDGWDGKDMFESASCKLFGDQRHGEREGDPNPKYDSHKCYFSPAILTRLFQAAGFVDVKTTPYGARETDIVVEAVKPRSGVIAAGGITTRIEGMWAEKTPKVTAKEFNDVLASLPENQERGEALRRKLRQMDEDWLKMMAENRQTAEGKEERKVIDGDSTAPKPQGVIYAEDPEMVADYQQRKLFDRVYFNGGAYKPFYWDYPCHELTARHVLARRPESVLELGCGRGYVLKRLQDAGIPAAGFEVSKHCYLTRVADGFNLVDLTQLWPLNSKDTGAGFDLCFSIAVLDHIPEEFLPHVFAEMERTCKRGLHGVNFGPAGDDVTRVTIHPKEWWQLRLPRGHEVVDKNELEGGPFPEDVFRGDGKIKLNVGCAQTMFHHGWTNLDVFDFGPWAQGHGYQYQKIDVRGGIPWGTGDVDLIYCGHMLEHLTYKEGLTFLRECRRVIKPDGAMRIIVPDAGLLAESYVNTENWIHDRHGDAVDRVDLSDFDEVNEGCALAPTAAGKLHALLCEGHHALYDEETLVRLLNEAGFVGARAKFRKAVYTASEQILRETLDTHPELSLFCDAVSRVG